MSPLTISPTCTSRFTSAAASTHELQTYTTLMELRAALQTLDEHRSATGCYWFAGDDGTAGGNWPSLLLGFL